MREKTHKGPFKYYVSHQGGGGGPSNAYIGLRGGGGGSAKILHAYRGGGVRQMLTHLKCCTSVDMTARDNACTQKIVKNWLKPLFN